MLIRVLEENDIIIIKFKLRLFYINILRTVDQLTFVKKMFSVENVDFTFNC